MARKVPTQQNGTVFKLTVYDRLTIPAYLPQEASFKESIIIRDLKLKLQITQKEIEKFDINGGPGGTITWNTEKDKGIPVDLTELEIGTIRDSFKVLDEKKKVPTDPRFIELYQKFVD